jgi:hypothetical protein
MTLRKLIDKLTYLSQQDGFDPDGEALVLLYDKNRGIFKDLPITVADWLWSDPTNLEESKKIVYIEAQMAD